MFGISADGYLLSRCRPDSKCLSPFSGATRLLLCRLPLIAALAASSRLARDMQRKFQTCQGTLLWWRERQDSNLRCQLKLNPTMAGRCRLVHLAYFPKLSPFRGRGSLAPRQCSLLSAVVGWFDFGGVSGWGRWSLSRCRLLPAAFGGCCYTLWRRANICGSALSPFSHRRAASR